MKKQNQKIFTCNKMDLNEIIKQSGLSKRKFCNFYNIPYNTLLNWTCNPTQANFRKCPPYIISLLEKAVKHDFC